MDKPDLEDLQQFVKEYAFPTDILIETTARCNLNCIMCPQEKLTRPAGRISGELWRKIIDEVAATAPETNIWPALMGEPLLHPDIFPMIAYAKDQGIQQIHMNSNLMAFKPAMLEDLFASRLDELVIGLDGATDRTFAKIRHGGDLFEVVGNIMMIIDEKEKRGLDHPRITLQFIVMDENAHEEQQFIDFWQQAGRDVHLKIKHRSGWADGVEPGQRICNVPQTDRHMPCTWLLRQMTIFWNGDIPQCDGDYDGRTNFGNVTATSLKKIWQQNLKVIRERHQRLDFNFAPCNGCEDWQAGRSKWIDCGGMVGVE